MINMLNQLVRCVGVGAYEHYRYCIWKSELLVEIYFNSLDIPYKKTNVKKVFDIDICE